MSEKSGDMSKKSGDISKRSGDMSEKSGDISKRFDYSLPNLAEICFNICIYTKNLKEIQSFHYGISEMEKHRNILVIN
jgi:hypothetical protein